MPAQVVVREKHFQTEHISRYGLIIMDEIFENRSKKN